MTSKLDELNYALEIAKKHNLDTSIIQEAISKETNLSQESDLIDFKKLLVSFDKYMFPWKSLSELTLDIINRNNLVYWCEFPAGGEARKCSFIRANNSKLYIVVDGIFKSNDLSQTVICWAFEKDYNANKIAQPYIMEQHRSLIRKLSCGSYCGLAYSDYRKIKVT